MVVRFMPNTPVWYYMEEKFCKSSQFKSMSTKNNFHAPKWVPLGIVESLFKS